jgi:hypothetical protein
MPRAKGSGAMGPVRSLRLPRGLDRWFEERLRETPDIGPSRLLLRLIHGGLRLRPHYMARHREALENYARQNDERSYGIYLQAVRDTLGDAYATHLLAWIHEGGFIAW